MSSIFATVIRFFKEPVVDASIGAIMGAIGAPLLVVISRIYIPGTGRGLYGWEQWVLYVLAAWMVLDTARSGRRAIRLWRMRRRHEDR